METITTKDKIFMLFSGLSCLILLTFHGRRADAAETGTVTATVTAQSLSIGVSDSTIAYTNMSVGTTKNTLAASLDDRQKASNDGNVDEDFNIKGMHSTSAGTTWALVGTTAPEAYTHGFNTDQGVGWTQLTTDYLQFGNAVAVGGTQWFDLQLGTPSSTTDTNEQTVNVTVQAVAD